jgi:hypothetical protein
MTWGFNIYSEKQRKLKYLHQRANSVISSRKEIEKIKFLFCNYIRLR